MSKFNKVLVIRNYIDRYICMYVCMYVYKKLNNIM